MKEEDRMMIRWWIDAFSQSVGWSHIITSQSTSLALGRESGSFCSSHRIRFRSSRDTLACAPAGIFTWASMIFRISAHWLRASKGCCRVAHWNTAQYSTRWVRLIDRQTYRLRRASHLEYQDPHCPAVALVCRIA